MSVLQASSTTAAQCSRLPAGVHHCRRVIDYPPAVPLASYLTRRPVPCRVHPSPVNQVPTSAPSPSSRLLDLLSPCQLPGSHLLEYRAREQNTHRLRHADWSHACRAKKLKRAEADSKADGNWWRSRAAFVLRPGCSGKQHATAHRHPDTFGPGQGRGFG